MSATMDVDHFSQYFNKAPVLYLEGRQYPIQVSIQLMMSTHELSPKRFILDSSKLKEFTDSNFELDENGRRFSKQVENTMGKGEIAHDEQFLLCLPCFQKTCTADT